MLHLIAIAAAALSLQDVKDESVLCLENAGSGETMWVALAEKYYSGAKTVRQVELAPGKRRCLRYDGLRNLTVNHYYMSEVERRIAEKDKIDPWRDQACEKLSKNAAVFYRLSSNGAMEMTCEVDTERDEESLRALVAEAKPFSM